MYRLISKTLLATLDETEEIIEAVEVEGVNESVEIERGEDSI